ncbi:hypothetical protein LX14_000416 [Williamsia deligens]|nr:hypothetical protein [Williamsia deligens]
MSISFCNVARDSGGAVAIAAVRDELRLSMYDFVSPNAPAQPTIAAAFALACAEISVDVLTNLCAASPTALPDEPVQPPVAIFD